MKWMLVLIAALALGAAACGVAQDLGVGGNSDSPAETDFRTVVKTQLLAQPGMSTFCYSIRGSSDAEVLAVMAGIIGQDGLSGDGSAQLRGAAIIKEECARAFP